MTDEVGMRLGDLEGIIAEEDGYMAEANAETLLSGMGIEEEYFTQKMHAIPTDLYEQFQEKVEHALAGRKTQLHFKDNEEMNASLFNILSYGNAQYMRDGDTWSTSQRTKDLRSYGSMSELFAENEIDEKRFRRFHEIRR